MDPREWDNVGTMYCWHGRYNLGDRQPNCTPDEMVIQIMCEDSGADESLVPLKDAHRYLEKHFIILPLYLYDHSGITMSTEPFSCPWDSGQVGFIIAPRGAEGMDDELLTTRLKGEVTTYDQYLTGDVYGYVIEGPDGELDDGSCWGFFGDDEYMTNQIVHTIDSDICERIAKAEHLQEVTSE